MKDKGNSSLLEAGLTLAGLCLSFLGALVKWSRQIRLEGSFSLIGSGLSLFLIGFGLLSLIGGESFAKALIIIGLVGLLISLAKPLFAFTQIGWIVAMQSFNRKK